MIPENNKLVQRNFHTRKLYSKVGIVAGKSYAPLLKQFESKNVLLYASDEITFGDLRSIIEVKDKTMRENVLWLAFTGIYSLVDSCLLEICRMNNCKQPVNGVQLQEEYCDPEMTANLMDSLVNMIITVQRDVNSCLSEGSDFHIMPPLPISVLSTNLTHKQLHDKFFEEWSIAVDWSHLTQLSDVYVKFCTEIWRALDSASHLSHPEYLIFLGSYQKLVYVSVVNYDTDKDLNVDLYVKGVNVFFRNVIEHKLPPEISRNKETPQHSQISMSNRYDQIIYIGRKVKLNYLSPKMPFQCSIFNANFPLNWLKMRDNIATYKTKYKKILFIIVADVTILTKEHTDNDCTSKCKPRLSYLSLDSDSVDTLATNNIQNILDVKANLEDLFRDDMCVIVAPLFPRVGIKKMRRKTPSLHDIVHKIVLHPSSPLFLDGEMQLWDRALQRLNCLWSKHFSAVPNADDCNRQIPLSWELCKLRSLQERSSQLEMWEKIVIEMTAMFAKSPIPDVSSRLISSVQNATSSRRSDQSKSSNTSCRTKSALSENANHTTKSSQRCSSGEKTKSKSQCPNGNSESSQNHDHPKSHQHTVNGFVVGGGNLINVLSDLGNRDDIKLIKKVLKSEELEVCDISSKLGSHRQTDVCFFIFDISFITLESFLTQCKTQKCRDNHIALFIPTNDRYSEPEMLDKVVKQYIREIDSFLKKFQSQAIALPLPLPPSQFYCNSTFSSDHSELAWIYKQAHFAADKVSRWKTYLYTFQEQWSLMLYDYYELYPNSLRILRRYLKNGDRNVFKICSSGGQFKGDATAYENWINTVTKLVISVTSGESSAPKRDSRWSTNIKVENLKAPTEGTSTSLATDPTRTLLPNSTHQTLLSNPTHQTILPNLAHHVLLPNPAHQTLLPIPAHQTLLPNPAHQTLLPNPAHQTLIPNPVHQTLLPNPTHQALLSNFTSNIPAHKPIHKTFLQNPTHKTILQNPTHKTVLQNPTHKNLLQITPHEILVQTPPHTTLLQKPTQNSGKAVPLCVPVSQMVNVAPIPAIISTDRSGPKFSQNTAVQKYQNILTVVGSTTTQIHPPEPPIPNLMDIPTNCFNVEQSQPVQAASYAPQTQSNFQSHDTSSHLVNQSLSVPYHQQSDSNTANPFTQCGSYTPSDNFSTPGKQDLEVVITGFTTDFPIKILLDFASSTSAKARVMEEKSDYIIIKFPFESAHMVVNKLNNVKLADFYLQAFFCDPAMQPIPLNEYQIIVINKIFDKMVIKWRLAISYSMERQLLCALDITNFKTTICLSDCVGKEMCRKYHNDDDKRRNPLTNSYSVNMCNQIFTSQAGCSKGSNCDCSHNLYEQFYHPNHFQTVLCASSKTGEECQKMPVCKFAHIDTPEVFFTQHWVDLIVFGLANTFLYITGAIKATIKNNLSKSARIFCVTSDLEYIRLLKLALARTAKDYKMELCWLERRNGTIKDLYNAQSGTIFLGTPSMFVKSRLLTSKPGYMLEPAVLIIDDVEAIFRNDKETESMYTFYQRLRSHPSNFMALQKVFVLANHTEKAPGTMSRFFGIPLKVVNKIYLKTTAKTVTDTTPAPKTNALLLSQIRSASLDNKSFNSGSKPGNVSQSYESDFPQREFVTEKKKSINDEPVHHGSTVSGEKHSPAPTVNKGKSDIDDRSARYAFSIKRSLQQQTLPPDKRQNTGHTGRPKSLVSSKESEENDDNGRKSQLPESGPSQKGDVLMSRFIEAKLKLVQEHEEELKVFKELPEVHPEYEKVYESFLSFYRTKFGNKRNDKHFDTNWSQFWGKHLDAVKNGHLEGKIKILRDTLGIAEEVVSKKPHLPEQSAKSSDESEFLLGKTFEILEELKERFGILGSPLQEMINLSRKFPPESKEALEVFADPAHTQLCNLIIQKMKVLRDTSRFTAPVYEMAINWTSLLLEKAALSKNIPTNIDTESIAKATLGKSPGFTLDVIRRELKKAGNPNPVKELVNKLYLEVCSYHFNLAAE